MPPLLEGLISREDIAELSRSEGLILDDGPRISILEASNSIDVQACPGSGKTTLIAAKLILLAKAWPYHSRGICVLSHTNVAKDEIIERLIQSETVEAQRLLNYPHFIGTIQEFVGKYIAFPWIRSNGRKVNLVDTEECLRLIYLRLDRGTRNYIDRKSEHQNVLYDFDLRYEGGNLEINVPTFPNGSQSGSYNDLKAKREASIADGYFLFRDVFVFAEMAIDKNPKIAKAMRERFPYVFIDEMQDTQKFQDDLLSRVFPLESPEIAVQRFGDPDQAIFHGIGNEEGNESFNGKAAADMTVVINKSHRFDNSLAEKIKPFSLNEINLETELTEQEPNARAAAYAHGQKVIHKIIQFDSETRAQVVEEFAEIVSREFSHEEKTSTKFTAKVVGAVGAEITKDDQVRLGSYWPGFSKTKSSKSFKGGSLIEAVRFCRVAKSADVASQYNTITDAVLRLLRMAGKTEDNGKPYSATSLREWLRVRSTWDEFRGCLYLLINRSYELNQEFWNTVIPSLRTALDIENGLAENAEDFIRFEEEVGLDENDANGADEEEDTVVHLLGNRVKHRDGFIVEASTIHGVKGETHHATLIVETKHHVFDLATMMPYLVGDYPDAAHSNRALPDSPNVRREFKPNKVFLRQLYVAMSRPKHLLCLALHADHVGDQTQRLLDFGWDVVTVGARDEEGDAEQ